jgi:hypothetical protein
MDISTFVTAFLTSGVFSLGAARWLTTRLVDHRFARDLQTYQATLDGELAASKAAFDQSLATAKAKVEAALRQDVDEYLGDKAADRQYRLDARKRLYAAIGPLRFQLVVACDNFSTRIDRIGSGRQLYDTSLEGYFGRSTAFRLLRLLAVAELIERQIAYADFSVDPSTAGLLRFKHEAFRCLSSGTIVLGHPKANWNDQVEHIFYDVLSIIASTMIVDSCNSTSARVMRFDEFNELVSENDRIAAISPLPRLMENFTIASKPILWIRFVALGQLCSSFVGREGPVLGIHPELYDGPKLLRASTDPYLKAHYDEYCQVLQSFARVVGSASH